MTLHLRRKICYIKPFSTVHSLRWLSYSNSRKIIKEPTNQNQIIQMKAQKKLHFYYLSQLNDPFYFDNLPKRLDHEDEIRELEDEWNKWEESRISHWTLPKKVSELPDWFHHIEQCYLKDSETLFNYLENEAPLLDVAYYLHLENKVDGKFDDLIALAQLGMQDPKMKLALARNYWDEMGNGNPEDIHTTLFSISANYMNQKLRESGIDPNSIEEPVEAIRNANLQMMYGIRRWWTPRFLGVLAILEQTAWRRFEILERGFKRLQIPETHTKYQRVHVDIDKTHGKELFEEVLMPLVSRDGPSEKKQNLLREISLGILLRMNVASDYYDGFSRMIGKYDQLRKDS